MPLPPFLSSKAPANLEDPGISCRENALHTGFGGWMKIAAPCGNGVDMGFRNRRRDHMGRVHLQIIPLHKKGSDGLNDPGTKPKGLFFQGESVAIRNTHRLTHAERFFTFLEFGMMEYWNDRVMGFGKCNKNTFF
jgi:hypothetical protein